MSQINKRTSSERKTELTKSKRKHSEHFFENFEFDDDNLRKKKKIAFNLYTQKTELKKKEFETDEDRFES